MAEKHTSSGDAAAKPKEPKYKLSDDFQPNEPITKSGLDKDGKPDDTLSPNQLGRAGIEAMLSLRPQPSKTELDIVLDELKEVDAGGQPKIKVKTAKEGGDKPVALLNQNDAKTA